MLGGAGFRNHQQYVGFQVIATVCLNHWKKNMENFAGISPTATLFSASFNTLIEKE